MSSATTTTTTRTTTKTTSVTAPAAAAASAVRPDVDAPTHADVDGDLSRMGVVIDGYEKHVYELVGLIDRVSRSGLVEELEGLPVEQVLALRFNLTRSEVWMLQTAGECLRACRPRHVCGVMG